MASLKIQKLIKRSLFELSRILLRCRETEKPSNHAAYSGNKAKSPAA